MAADTPAPKKKVAKKKAAAKKAAKKSLKKKVAKKKVVAKKAVTAATSTTPVAGKPVISEHERLEEPRRVGEVPSRWADVWHRLNDAVLGRQRSSHRFRKRPNVAVAFG